MAWCWAVLCLFACTRGRSQDLGGAFQEGGPGPNRPPAVTDGARAMDGGPDEPGPIAVDGDQDRDGRPTTPDGDLPAPFRVGDCRLEAVNPREHCGSDADCPVVGAGELICAGGSYSQALSFDGTYLYASLQLRERWGAPASLVGARIQLEDGALRVHAVDDVTGGMLRMDGTQAVLLALKDNELVPHRADADFEAFAVASPLPVVGTPWDAYFAPDGQLHVYSTLLSRPSEPLHDGLPLASDALTVDAAAARTPAGRFAVAYFADEPGPEPTRAATLVLDTGESIRLHQTAAHLDAGGLAIAIAPHTQSPSGFVVAAHDGALMTWGAGADGVPLARFGAASACNRQMTVYAPDICPGGTDALQLGELLVDLGVVADDVVGAWMVLLVGQGEESCRWYPVSGCFETLPCDCQQSGQVTTRMPRLRFIQIAEQTRTFDLPLTELPMGQLVYTALRDGELFVGMVSGVPGGSTSLRFLRVRLADAPTSP